MLVISTLQSEQIEKVKRKEFVEDIVNEIEKSNSQYSRNFERIQLIKIVEKSIDDGVLLGFETRNQIARFVNFRIICGPSFPNDPKFSWASSIIEDDDLLPWQKMDNMEKAVMKILEENESKKA